MWNNYKTYGQIKINRTNNNKALIEYNKMNQTFF